MSVFLDILARFSVVQIFLKKNKKSAQGSLPKIVPTIEGDELYERVV
jgi:hypothetical protein